MIIFVNKFCTYIKNINYFDKFIDNFDKLHKNIAT